MNIYVTKEEFVMEAGARAGAYRVNRLILSLKDV